MVRKGTPKRNASFPKTVRFVKVAQFYSPNAFYITFLYIYLLTMQKLSSTSKLSCQKPYANDANYSDEWELFTGTANWVKLEGQEKSNWCWAATARMFAKNYHPLVTHTQSDAVMYAKNLDTPENQTGDLFDAKRAINYYAETVFIFVPDMIQAIDEQRYAEMLTQEEYTMPVEDRPPKRLLAVYDYFYFDILSQYVFNEK